MRIPTFAGFLLILVSGDIGATVFGPTNADAGTAFSLSWDGDVGDGTILPSTLKDVSTGISYGSSPSSFTKTVAGTYVFEEEYCFDLMGSWICGTLDSHTVTVASGPPPPAPPVAETLDEQFDYDFDLRVGDFNSDGYTDILVDRVTAGGVDGTMQTVIVRGNSNGASVVVPSASELSHARTFPTNPNLTVGGTDGNFDGYMDVVIEGLDILGSISYSYDCLILYASGVAGVSQPLGLKFIDEEYSEFFGNIGQALVNPNFYLENLDVVFRPIFATLPECFLTTSDFGICRMPTIIVGIDVQVQGIGFNILAPNASAATEAVRNNDHSFGDPFKRLSDALKLIIGVNSFGFQDNGSRVPTNHRRPGDTLEEELEEARLWYLASTLYWRANVPPPPDATEWPRHDYDVGDPGIGTRICSTTSNYTWAEDLGLPVPVSRTIPASVCTLENVWCWAKRKPANIADQDDTSTTISGETNDLQWGNPVTTYAYDNERVLVNVTQEGHWFHDTLQAEDCGENKKTVTELNNVSGPNGIGRCAYVHRQVVPRGNDIHITTHGEGHNPGNTAVLINELAGEFVVFPPIDRWIQRQLATQGACVDDPLGP